MDNETWLIEVGDEIIEKKSNSSYENLNDLEQSIYCLWVIDYAVRNSGTLDPIVDLHPSAITELIQNAENYSWPELSSLLKKADNAYDFCDKYYDFFEKSCNELRSAYENTTKDSHF